MPVILMKPASSVGLLLFWLLSWWCCCRDVTGLSSSFSSSSASSVGSGSTASATTTTTTASSLEDVRAISFDVTGTLLATREPVVKSYRDALVWSRFPDPVPTEDELRAGFKIAFRERGIESPCFGGAEGISGREWWQTTIRRVLHHSAAAAKRKEEEETNNNDNDDELLSDWYGEEDFQRFFRRIYQHFGSPRGYRVLDDAEALLSSIAATSREEPLVLGITSNTPTRHTESVLPMLNNFHERFSWFTCSQDVGHEKPSREIFDDALEKARFWCNDPALPRESVLHIGDSYACDYCGARAYGFRALLLDRSGDPSVATYQDWLDAPDYPNKSPGDAEKHTIRSLEEVATLLRL